MKKDSWEERHAQLTRDYKKRILVRQIIHTVLFVLLLCILFVLFGFLVAMLSGCSDGCEPGESRCAEDVLMYCNVDGDWETSIDCNAIEMLDESKIEWECCEDPEDGELVCLPREECK